jgi:hypothetical protein
VSLSQEPAFSALREHFICGVRDISREPYAGVSGLHEKTGNAVNTTNGAGPHNLQLFMLSSDGTVLQCLPGYWNPRDLVTEMQFADQLNQVWHDPKLSLGQKDQLFRNMQLSHMQNHSQAMVRRSRMQGFDQKYEAMHRLYRSDAIAHPEMIRPGMLEQGGKLPQMAFKTTDELMHERMSQRPFVAFSQFDTAAYVDYGKPRYDKHEDARNADGSVNKELAKEQPIIGNTDVLQKRQKRRNRRWMQDSQYSGNTSWNSGPTSAGSISGGNGYNSVQSYNWSR